MTSNPKKSSRRTELHRIPIEYSAYYAVQEPAVRRPEPPALLIAAHGYGESARSFIRKFKGLKEKNVLVVAPQGPNQFYWRSRPPRVGFTWVTSHETEQTVRDNLAYLIQLRQGLAERYDHDENRVFLLGFSNGCSMAFRLAVRGGAAPRGMIACGGDLPVDVERLLESSPPFPVLVVHGKQDEMMEFARAKRCEEALIEAGYPVETHYFEGGHEVPPEAVRAIGEWIDP